MKEQATQDGNENRKTGKSRYSRLTEREKEFSRQLTARARQAAKVVILWRTNRGREKRNVHSNVKGEKEKKLSRSNGKKRRAGHGEEKENKINEEEKGEKQRGNGKGR